MADRISGTTRFVRGAVGKGVPPRLAVPARCSIHLAPCMLLAEFDGPDMLWVRFAVPVLNDGDGSGREILPGVELSQRIEMRGSVLIANHYAGCPWCGNREVISCSCGVYSCGGPHGRTTTTRITAAAAAPTVDHVRKPMRPPAGGRRRGAAPCLPAGRWYGEAELRHLSQEHGDGQAPTGGLAFKQFSFTFGHVAAVAQVLRELMREETGAEK